MALLLWNSAEKGRFVSGTGPNLSQGGVAFVPGTGSCLSRTPSRSKCLCLLGFSCPVYSGVTLRGFSLRGFGDVRGFPFCVGKKGLKLPLAMGKGSETPSFLMLRPRERGSLRPFSPLQEGVSDPFSHRKRGTSYILKSLSANPLSATHKCVILSLLKDDQIVRDNRLPIHCRHLASRRYRTLIPVATQMSGNAEGSRNSWVMKFHGRLGC